MKLTVLMENTAADPSLLAEHGLSLYIETEGLGILFDMGQTDRFVTNAERMGVDLSRVDLAVLSHGHYDHGGGLSAFWQVNQTAPVYIHETAFGEYFNGKEEYIGLDPCDKTHPRIILTQGERVLAPHVRLFDGNELVRTYGTDPYGLKKQQGTQRVADDFAHEQYLVIEEQGKRILVSGCSHKGILNLMEWVNPHVVIGGFHFMKLDPTNPDHQATLDSATATLQDYDCTYYTCHCTGEEPFAYCKQTMGEAVTYIRAGDRLEL